MRKMKRSDRQIKQQLDTEVAGSSDVTRIPIFTYLSVPGLTEAFSVLLSHLIFLHLWFTSCKNTDSRFTVTYSDTARSNALPFTPN